MTKLPFALIVLGAVVLAGCNKTTQPQGDQVQQQEQTMEQSREQMTEQFQMVAEAMAAGEPVVCQLTNANGTSFTYSSMGQKIRVQGQLSPESPYEGTMLSDGEYIYTWSSQSPQGMKFKKPAVDDFTGMQAKDDESEQQDIPDFSNQTTQNQYENLGYNVQCAQEAIPDETFVPPTNITFSDTSDMMERAQQMMRQDSSEAASEAGQGNTQMDVEQVKKIMQGYEQ